MSEHDLQQDGELDVEELEEVAGGASLDNDSEAAINENCGNNCHC